MIELKFLLTFLLLSLIFSLIRVKFSNNLRVFEKLIFLFFVISAQIIIIKPKLLFYLASPLKIDRGIDLVFYFYIFFSLWGFIRNHMRLNILSKNLNLLTSRLAVENPVKNNDP